MGLGITRLKSTEFIARPAFEARCKGKGNNDDGAPGGDHSDASCRVTDNCTARRECGRGMGRGSAHGTITPAVRLECMLCREYIRNPVFLSKDRFDHCRCSVEEIEALEQLYAATGGAQWTCGAPGRLFMLTCLRCLAQQRGNMST